MTKHSQFAKTNNVFFLICFLLFWGVCLLQLFSNPLIPKCHLWLRRSTPAVELQFWSKELVCCVFLTKTNPKQKNNCPHHSPLATQLENDQVAQLPTERCPFIFASSSLLVYTQFTWIRFVYLAHFQRSPQVALECVGSRVSCRLLAYVAGQRMTSEVYLEAGDHRSPQDKRGVQGWWQSPCGHLFVCNGLDW